MRKQKDLRREDERVAESAIRAWLRRADEFLRRPPVGDVSGKTGGDRDGPDDHGVQSGSKR